MTLSELSPGKSGTVKQVLTDGILAQRIVDMGLYPGIVVNVIRNAPLGDPVEIEADGTFISLRRLEARFVEIVPAP